MWLHHVALDSCHLLLCTAARDSNLLQKRTADASGEQLQQAILDDVLPLQSCGILDSYTANAKPTLTSTPSNYTGRARHGDSCGHTPAGILVPKAEVGTAKQTESCRGAACGTISWLPFGSPKGNNNMGLSSLHFLLCTSGKLHGPSCRQRETE